MKIFVSGASGVIGRRLVAILRRADHDVTAAGRSPIRRAELQRLGATVVDLDLFDGGAVVKAVAGHDAVINLATHIPASSMQVLLPWAWRENDRLRRVASRVLVEACIAARVRRLVQESFAPVYPDRGDTWIDERMPIETVRFNRTVSDAEAAALRFSQTGSVGVVLRFASFYGPDAFQTRDLIASIKRGWSPIPGPESAYISSISHDDAASATAASIALPSGIYNVVDDDPVTHKVFADSLADAMGIPRPRLLPRWVTPLFGSAGALLARSVRISNRKLRAASGWSPAYPSVRQGWPAVLAELGDAPEASRHVVNGPSSV